MSTVALQTPDAAVTDDDFASLERRILRAVELFKSERAGRLAAEEKVAELHQSLEAQTNELLRVEMEVEAFKSERDLVRGRIERLLGQLDELSV